MLDVEFWMEEKMDSEALAGMTGEDRWAVEPLRLLRPDESGLAMTGVGR